MSGINQNLYSLKYVFESTPFHLSENETPKDDAWSQDCIIQLFVDRFPGSLKNKWILILMHFQIVVLFLKLPAAMVYGIVLKFLHDF